MARPGRRGLYVFAIFRSWGAELSRGGRPGLYHAFDSDSFSRVDLGRDRAGLPPHDGGFGLHWCAYRPLADLKHGRRAQHIRNYRCHCNLRIGRISGLGANFRAADGGNRGDSADCLLFLSAHHRVVLVHPAVWLGQTLL